jgi:lipid-A-disaccharide synthase
MKILVSSGEASGDHLAATLVSALKERVPRLDSWGMGGRESRKCGMRVEWASEELQLMGIGEVLSSIPRLLRLKHEICRRVCEEKPVAVVAVDSPDFHIPLLRQLRQSGYEGMIIYLAPPQVWAWRSGRTAFLRETCDLCLPLFDFENDFLAASGVNSAWAGHPFVDEFPNPEEKGGPGNRGRSVALLPGSRASEIRRLLPVLKESAVILKDKGFEPVFSIAPGLDSHERQWLSEALSGFRTDAGEGRTLMRNSCCVIGASGTASVEAMMLDLFMIVLYRVSLSSEVAFRFFVKTPHISIPNHLAGCRLYPELVQGQARTSGIMEYFEGYWADERKRNHFHERLGIARSRMGKPGAAGFWARCILDLLGRT